MFKQVVKQHSPILVMNDSDEAPLQLKVGHARQAETDAVSSDDPFYPVIVSLCVVVGYA
jgi:hypothetical protein